MAYLTEQSLDDAFGLPLFLPTTALSRGDWMVVTALCLPDDATLEIRGLQLRLEGGDGAGAGTLSLSLLRDYDPGLPPWAGDAADGTAPTATAVALEAPLQLPYPLDCARSLAGRDPGAALTLTGPGLYHVVLGFRPTGEDPDPALPPSLARVSVAGQGRFAFSR